MISMRWGPDLGTHAPEVLRFRGGPPIDLLPPAFNWEISFIINAPHLVILLRRISLGFTLQPHDKLEKEEDDGGIEGLDVGQGWGATTRSRHITTPSHRNITSAYPNPLPLLHRPTAH